MSKLLQLFALTILILVLPSLARGQFVLDDFEDGSVSDGNPVSWFVPPYSNMGTREVIDGDYVLDRSNDVDMGENTFGNVSVRTQFHRQGGDIAGLYARNNFGVSPNGSVWAYIDESMINVGQNVNQEIITLQTVGVDWEQSDDDINMQFDVYGDRAALTVWQASAVQPRPQIDVPLRFIPEGLESGTVGIWTWGTNDGEVRFRHVETQPVVIEAGGPNQLGTHQLLDSVHVTTAPTNGLQTGLLNRWFSVRNPGSYDGVLGRVYDPLFPENGLEPDVPAFHVDQTWWTGNRQTIGDLPAYPIEVIGQARKHDGGVWNGRNNDDYTVALEGEILIPESGSYRFLDGIDDYVALGIDLDRDGAVTGDELIIDDNVWTDLNRNLNGGGLPGDAIPQVIFDAIKEGGEWFKIEVFVAEGSGGDSGIIYWDYDANDRDGDGVKIGDALGFPASAQGEGRTIADEDIAHLFIGNEFLRSEGGVKVTSGTTEGRLADVTYRLELGANGEHDQIVVNPLWDEITTTLDLNGATIEVAALSDVSAQPGEYLLLDADNIIGRENATVVLGPGLGNVDADSLLSRGILVVLHNLDCSRDGVVDVWDLNCTSADELATALSQLGLRQGDADGNGKVEFADFITLAENFDQEATYTEGDFNKDGRATFADFVILSGNFSRGAGAAAVPEPSSSKLAYAVLLFALAISLQHFRLGTPYTR